MKRKIIIGLVLLVTIAGVAACASFYDDPLNKAIFGGVQETLPEWAQSSGWKEHKKREQEEEIQRLKEELERVKNEHKGREQYVPQDYDSETSFSMRDSESYIAIPESEQLEWVDCSKGDCYYLNKDGEKFNVKRIYDSGQVKYIYFDPDKNVYLLIPKDAVVLK